MVDRNNAGRLSAGFISVCLETRWLGDFGGFYVPEPPCISMDQKGKTDFGAEVGKGVKRNPTQIWPYLCGILLNSFPN